MLAEAHQVRLEVVEAPWEDFEVHITVLMEGLGLDVGSPQAPLIFQFALSGRTFEQEYQVSASDRSGRMHNTYETRSLPVGYQVEGELTVKAAGLAEAFPVGHSQSGPSKIGGNEWGVAERAQKEVLLQTIGGVCEWLLEHSVSITQAVQLTLHGKSETEQMACLEWLPFNSKYRRPMIETIFSYTSEQVHLARAIRAIGRYDVWHFCQKLTAFKDSGHELLVAAIGDLKRTHSYFTCPSV